MFTGIIQHLGTVEKSYREDGAVRLEIATDVAGDLKEGASLAVNGVCLTVLQATATGVVFQLMAETLQRTNLGFLKVDDVVNLELPLRANQVIDGHFVLGHVDGLAEVKKIKEVKNDKIFTWQLSRELLPYFIPKGSVALDGVSLTVVDVGSASFSVSMMPYTLDHTLFERVDVGYKANVEVDILGKYVKRILDSR